MKDFSMSENMSEAEVVINRGATEINRSFSVQQRQMFKKIIKISFILVLSVLLLVAIIVTAVNDQLVFFFSRLFLSFIDTLITIVWGFLWLLSYVMTPLNIIGQNLITAECYWRGKKTDDNRRMFMNDPNNGYVADLMRLTVPNNSGTFTNDELTSYCLSITPIDMYKSLYSQNTISGNDEYYKISQIIMEETGSAFMEHLLIFSINMLMWMFFEMFILTKIAIWLGDISPAQVINDDSTYQNVIKVHTKQIRDINADVLSKVDDSAEVLQLVPLLNMRRCLTSYVISQIMLCLLLTFINTRVLIVGGFSQFIVIVALLFFIRMIYALCFLQVSLFVAKRFAVLKNRNECVV